MKKEVGVYAIAHDRYFISRVPTLIRHFFDANRHRADASSGDWGTVCAAGGEIYWALEFLNSHQSNTVT